MPAIGANCHELRVKDQNITWRIFYGLTSDAVVVLEVAEKKTRTTPKHVLDIAKRRWREYLKDQNITWRIFYGLTSDAVVVLEVAEKKTRTTPKHVLDIAKRRWREYL